MDNEISKFLSLSDLVKIEESTQENSGYKVKVAKYISPSQELSLTLWHSNNVLSFYQVEIKVQGQTFKSSRDVSQLDPTLFLDYYKSLDQLSDSQLKLVIDYTESLVKDIRNKFDNYSKMPINLRSNSYVLGQIIVGQLKHYLAVKELIDRHDSTQLVTLFKLLSPQMDSIVEVFDSWLKEEHVVANQKVKELYSQIFK